MFVPDWLYTLTMDDAGPYCWYIVWVESVVKLMASSKPSRSVMILGSLPASSRAIVCPEPSAAAEPKSGMLLSP